MFASRNHPLDFSDTRVDARLGLPHLDRLDPGIDPLEQIAQADRADLELLRLVVCVALATLVVALAGSL